jgi:hypothetical protein
LVPVMILVPVVIVIKPSTIAFPIARIILPPLVAGSHPSSAHVRSSCVVSLMPFVMSSGRVPVSLDPNVALARTTRYSSIAPGLRRRANIDAEGNLGSGRRCACQQHDRNKQRCQERFPNRIEFSFAALSN